MELPNRKSIRLKGYDYSQNGCYFVTICTQDRDCIFGNITNKKMVLNDVGNIIKNNCGLLTKRFLIKLDEYQIMPNHFHLIIAIVGAGLVPARDRVTINRVETNRATTRVAPTNTPTLGEIIGAFKSITTDEYINGVKNYHWPSFNKRLWQRNYYEHIIRNACPAEPHHEPCSNRTRRRMARFCGENELYKIQEYIKLNPMGWEQG